MNESEAVSPVHIFIGLAWQQMLSNRFRSYAGKQFLRHPHNRRGTPHRYHRSMKNIVKLQNYYFAIEPEINSDFPKGYSILVVEDNQTNLDMIKYLLSIHSHQVSVARNGKEAISKAQLIKPNLILMDIHMPIMGGLEATRNFREMEFFTNTPIIALTASAGEDSREDCLNAGCTDHISKPIQSSELFSMLKLYLKTSYKKEGA